MDAPQASGALQTADAIQPALDGLVSAMAEHVASRAVYQLSGPGAEAALAKLQAAYIAFNDACDKAQLQLEAERRRTVRQQSQLENAKIANNGSGGELSDIQDIQLQTAALFQELQKSSKPGGAPSTSLPLSSLQRSQTAAPLTQPLTQPISGPTPAAAGLAPQKEQVLQPAGNSVIAIDDDVAMGDADTDTATAQQQQQPLQHAPTPVDSSTIMAAAIAAAAAANAPAPQASVLPGDAADIMPAPAEAAVPSAAQDAILPAAVPAPTQNGISPFADIQQQVPGSGQASAAAGGDGRSLTELLTANSIPVPGTDGAQAIQAATDILMGQAEPDPAAAAAGEDMLGRMDSLPPMPSLDMSGLLDL